MYVTALGYDDAREMSCSSNQVCSYSQKKNVLPKLSYYMPDIEADRAIDAKENVLCMNDK
jgi:hypothetical protein